MQHKTNKQLFEKELADIQSFWHVHATLDDASYCNIQVFISNNPLMKAAEEILNSGVRNERAEQGNLLDVALGTVNDHSTTPSSTVLEPPMTAEYAAFEKELANVHAILHRTPSRNALGQKDRDILQSFMMNPHFLDCVIRVLVSGVQNLAHEREDATEFALAVNLN